jgi:hypothetical protein
MSNEFERVSVSDWEVESLRVTAFPAQNAEVKPDDWWQEVLGSDPETQLIKAKRGEKSFQGAFEGGQLRLQVQPGRIDWLLASAVSNDEQPTEDFMPSVGRFDATCPRFKGLVERWLASSPPLKRIAFGAVILQQVPDRATGYKRLIPYLPFVKIDPDGSRDLLYRINRPRISRAGIKDLRINRLTTWSVGTIAFKAFTVTGGQPSIVTPGKEAFVCRVELDINTAAEFSGQFVPDQSRGTLFELVELGVEIIEKGDVP